MVQKKKPTIIDIAKELGVSNSTVSRSLADSPLISAETKRRVRAMALKMSYLKNPLANSLRTGQTNIIELLYYTYSEHLFNDPILLLIMDTVYQELKTHDYHVMLNIHKEFQEDHEDFMLQKGVVDGTILVSAVKIPTHYQSYLDNSRCVILDNTLADYSCVFFDFDDSINQLLEYLAAQGSERIMALTRDYHDHYSLNARRISYNKMFERYHHQLQNLGVIAVAETENPFLQIRTMKPAPDAVICLSQLEPLISSAEKEGAAIPDELTVATFTDLESALFKEKYPGIAHITLNWHELTRQAVLCLIGLIKGDHCPPQMLYVKPTLVT